MPSSNQYKKPAERIVNWGKYAGKKFGEVPTSYLQWFVENAHPQMVNRRLWAKEELKLRLNKAKHETS